MTSAVTLYKAGDYSTAVGLAALAWEELGRSRYLKDQRKKVVEGNTVSVKDIKKTCEDHVTKQEWGQVSTVQRFRVDSVLGKLITILHHAKPQSKEYQYARQELDHVTERKRARAPQDRHDERKKAFYVEPSELGTDWNRPWEKDKETAHCFLEDAINEYSLQFHKFANLDLLRSKDTELANAIEAWKERPPLPANPTLC